ncbi:MAG: sel1 repeat family protein [Clostridiales bacterium]|nr:sel1 repeat family protein [Clostridiales bacterium]
MKDDNIIFVTTNKLADFARFATDWDEIASDSGADPMAECEFESTYPLVLADLKEALECVRDDKILIGRFLMSWWYPLILKCDDALMIRDIFTNVASPVKMEPSLPVTDDDMLIYVLDVIADFSNSDLNRFASLPVTDLFDIDLLLEEINMFEEDCDRPVSERQFSERMRERFIMQLDNNVLLDDSDEDTKMLWKQFTDELAELGNFNAMRIKAYACYGGNSVYACDWKESARLLEILWREHSFGQAANTLGYIYYYGRLAPDGKPDYEKAFFYFSIGSTYGIVESKYKLADMFVNGYYVARNEKLARDIISDLYHETRYRFENGDFGCDFADLAYRMGKLFRDASCYELDSTSRKGALEVSKIYLLQARFAIEQRMRTDYSYGDDKVKDNIDKMLAEVSKDLPLADKSVYHSFNPIFVSLFTDGKIGSRYEISMKHLKNGSLRFRINRRVLPGAAPSFSLVVLPWFDECVYTEHIEFTLSDIDDVITFYEIYDPGSSLDNVLIDSVKTVDADHGDFFTMIFYCEGSPVLRVTAGDIIYKSYLRGRKKKD